MLSYIILTIFIFICSCLDLVEIGRLFKSILFITASIVLILFLGTRLVGPDLWTYESMYNITPSLPKLLKEFPLYTALTRFEPFYLTLNGLFKWVGASFHVLMLSFTAAFCVLFFCRLHYYTKYKFVALMVFLAYGYISGFSAIRQVMAASVFFYALKYLINRQRAMYAFLILIACLFHASAFILFVFLFIGQKRFSSRMIVSIVSLLIFCVYSRILNILARKVLLKIPFLSVEKVEMYLHGEGHFLGTVSIVWIVILLTSLLWRDRFEKLDPYFNLYLNILWMGLAIYSVSVGFGEFGRVLMYFKLVYVIILPLYVSLFKEMTGKVLMTVCIGILSSAFFFAAILTDTQYSSTNRYLPYKSWLFRE
jgi:transmembrane protein EpsG